jgi:hypothetical protein
MKLTTLALTAAATAVTTIALPATAHADPTPACSSGQVQVSVAGLQGASGHSEETLMFSLAPGAVACTLTGYPGVDTGAGGPTIHAERTLSGAMGGVQGPTPPTVTLLSSKPAYARVEGAVIDANGNECPNYTTLQVTPPDTTDTVTVPTDIYFCRFQVHPVTPQP